MDNRVFIGIDPGVSGGIGIIYNDRAIVKATPPTIKEMADIVQEIIDISPDIPMYAIIEQVHSMPAQGVKSVFTFGQNYGSWLGILALARIPYIQVTPHKWMKHYGSMPKEKKDRKNHLKHLGQQRFPNIKITLKTSDAILLANYLRENNKQ